jgi:hypothetical protein
MQPLDNANPVRAIAVQDLDADIVRVDSDAIGSLARPSDMGSRGSVLPVGSPLARNPQAFVPYLVAMNTMNFQFWDIDENGAFVRYRQGGLVGSHAMMNSFYQDWLDVLGKVSPDASIEDQAFKVEAAFGPRLERDGVEFLFGDIPAAQARREILLEVLAPHRLTVVSDFLARRLANTNALDWRDARVLAESFPLAYGDRYLKKAQLTLTFLAAAWNDFFYKPCQLSITAAADYQLPKVLRTLGLLHYSDALAAKVDNGELIEAGSKEENAIRAATIVACDLLAEQFNASTEDVDSWLWLNRNKDRDAKFHLTRTTAY